jgi:F-type H+-transporting ATPase subunit a
VENATVVWHIGALIITDVVITSYGLTLVLGLGAWLISRHLNLDPGPVQTALEGIVSLIETAISEVLPRQTVRILPFVGTLWIFLTLANLTGLIPGLNSPTRNLSATAALAALVFLAVHWFGIRSQGLGGYLRHYLAPNPILLPFHLVSEVTRTVALAVRLFGNIMSLEIAALLVLLVGGLLVPIPLLILHIVEALVQAYIFGMLALIYIAGGIQSQQQRQRD